MATETKEILVSSESFAAIRKIVNPMLISASSEIPGKFRYAGNYYAMTGTTYKGSTLLVHGMEVEHASRYKDEHLEPLRYGPHFEQVRKRNRPRSYAGMLVEHRGEKWVFIGEKVVFKKRPDNEQGVLF